MSLKTTLLAASAAVALSAFSAAAATVLTVGSEGSGADVETIGQPDGSTTLDFGRSALIGDFELDMDFNLLDQTALLFDPNFFGAGSLTIGTFVDPFAPRGFGAADVLLRFGTTLVADSITVQWGTGPEIDLSSGSETNISTSFDFAGQVQDLTFTWNNLDRVEQISTNLVAAVPVPAGVLLLTTALGGLGLARRRRKHDA